MKERQVITNFAIFLVTLFMGIGSALSKESVIRLHSCDILKMHSAAGEEYEVYALEYRDILQGKWILNYTNFEFTPNKSNTKIASDLGGCMDSDHNWYASKSPRCNWVSRGGIAGNDILIKARNLPIQPLTVAHAFHVNKEQYVRVAVNDDIMVNIKDSLRNNVPANKIILSTALGFPYELVSKNDDYLSAFPVKDYGYLSLRTNEGKYVNYVGIIKSLTDKSVTCKDFSSSKNGK